MYVQPSTSDFSVQQVGQHYYIKYLFKVYSKFLCVHTGRYYTTSSFLFISCVIFYFHIKHLQMWEKKVSLLKSLVATAAN